jgi:chromosome segregation ATPase
VETAALIDRDRQISELRRQVAELRSAGPPSAIQNQLVASQQAAETAQATARAAELATSAAESALVDLRSQLTSLTKNYEAERASVAALQLQLDEARKFEAEIQDKLSSAAAAAAAREQTLQAQIDDLSRRFTSSENKRAALHEQVH